MNCERACELLERLRAVLADVLVAGELVFLPESSPVLPESSPSASCVLPLRERPRQARSGSH